MQIDNHETLPAVQEAMSDIKALEAYAANYSISTAEQYTSGAADLQRVKAAQKKLEDTRTGITGPMNAALKRVNDFFRAPAERLTTIERTIKRGLTVFAEAEERQRQEKQRKADELARREREKAEAAARQARAKADAEAAGLRRRAEAEAAAGRAEEAAKLAARAEAKIEKADAKAEQLEQQAAAVVAPVVQDQTPTFKGLSMRDSWKFEVVDPAKVPREFLAVDDSKIRRYVQAMKGDSKIDGVRVYCEKVSASAAA